MHRRFLFLAAAFLAFGLGTFEARAGSVTLPTALDGGLTTTTTNSGAIQIATSNGNTATVNGAESLTFSNFGYTSTATGTTAYSATAVSVGAYTVGNETGITFSAGFGSPSGSTQDEAITYTVTAPQGQTLTDALLSVTGSAAGNGFATIGETIYIHGTSTVIGQLSVDVPGSAVETITLSQAVQSIDIVKDINLNGGTQDGSHASVSVVTQAFSSQGMQSVPEPTSMALLGIGMAGFFTYRRLFKRPATV